MISLSKKGRALTSEVIARSEVWNFRHEYSRRISEIRRGGIPRNLSPIYGTTCKQCIQEVFNEKTYTITYVNLFVVSEQLSCLCIHDMNCAVHELLIIYV